MVNWSVEFCQVVCEQHEPRGAVCEPCTMVGVNHGARVPTPCNIYRLAVRGRIEQSDPTLTEAEARAAGLVDEWRRALSQR